MRIVLIDTTSLMTQAPSSQAGAVRGRAWVPKMFLASCCRAIEMPKVASSVSSGRLYSQRITSRSIATPAAKVTAKASGIAIRIETVWFGTICCTT